MGLQAARRLPDTVAGVRALMKHPAFDIKNPNRVRALIGAFAGNHLRFHMAPARLWAGGRDDPRARPHQSAGRRPHGRRLRNLAALRRQRQELMRAELEAILAQKEPVAQSRLKSRKILVNYMRLGRDQPPLRRVALEGEVPCTPQRARARGLT